jgi:hypothetical protein
MQQICYHLQQILTLAGIYSHTFAAINYTDNNFYTNIYL